MMTKGGKSGGESRAEKGGGKSKRRKEDSREVGISKSFAFMLRHGAEKAGLKMDGDGFVALASLLQKMKGIKGGAVSVEEAEHVVATNDKQRFKLESRDGVVCIRANQGHSVAAVEDKMHQEVRSAEELPLCIHGTYYAAWELIKAGGLCRMGRRHIHMAVGEFDDDEVVSGMRGSAEISVHIDVAKALAAGVRFLRSENGVILSPGLSEKGIIPPHCILKGVDRKNQEIMWVPPAASPPKDGGGAAASEAVRLESAPAAAAALSLGSLIDIGANLTNRDFERDLPQVIERAHQAGVSAILVTGTSLLASQKASKLASRHAAAGLFFTAGIHPHDAQGFDGEKCLLAMRRLLEEDHCVAVGECGLDYNRNYSTREEQLACFEAQVALACELGMPMFCHEREAHRDFVAVLDSFKERLPPVVVHCFTGTSQEADVYITNGYFLGLTGTICMAERGKDLREMIQDHIPLGRLLLETDAPFMHPCPKKAKKQGGGKQGGRPRCEPMHLTEVAATVAECLGVTLDVVSHNTTQNAISFFRLPKEAGDRKDHHHAAAAAAAAPFAAKEKEEGTSPRSKGERRKGGGRLQHGSQVAESV